MRYCVQCGKKCLEDQPNWKTRCPECFKNRAELLRQGKAGGQKDWKWVHGHWGTIPVSHAEPQSWTAQYCTLCGHAIDIKKIRYAVVNRNECKGRVQFAEAKYCGDCEVEARRLYTYP